jgi:hypothetical protein
LDDASVDGSSSSNPLSVLSSGCGPIPLGWRLGGGCTVIDGTGRDVDWLLLLTITVHAVV